MKPRTAFSGVRISWLMLARNWLLARLALSATSRACSRSAWVFSRSAISLRNWAVRSRNALFQLVVRLLQRRFGKFDVVEHEVEGQVQAAQLVLGIPARADAVIALLGDPPGGLREVQDRFGDDLSACTW